MRQTLTLHPDFQCDAVSHIDVDVARPAPGVLTLGYRATGKIADLHLPPQTSPTRADDLWRRTCFEAFVRPTTGEAYVEFNLAPTGQWATYGFDDYRTGMTSPPGVQPPRIETRRTASLYEMDVFLTLDELPGLLGDADWRIGVSAVIEEAGGRTSLWALTHPPGKADFHHADGFSCELARIGSR